MNLDTLSLTQILELKKNTSSFAIIIDNAIEEEKRCIRSGIK
jgi:hypothetical protein